MTALEKLIQDTSDMVELEFPSITGTAKQILINAVVQRQIEKHLKERS
jgi:c-di-GMP-binding flagellar brake protein YcgR